MENKLIVSLQNVRFRAFHGVHPEEREKGNDFDVCLHASYVPKNTPIVSLDQTLDYAVFFNVINEVMQQPVELLETVAENIIKKVRAVYPDILSIEVKIEKLNPPIDHFSGSASVTMVQTA